MRGGHETSGGTKGKFTTYERDAESGNDFAMARYNVSRLGRFNSPDLLAGSIGDPQSLNRYAYVRNNPTGLIDPFGLAPCYGTVAEPPPSGDTCPPLVDETQSTEWHLGYDIFDVIMGARGIFSYTDPFGNLQWGTSVELFMEGASQYMGSAVVGPSGLSFFVIACVSASDSATDSTVSGCDGEWITLEETQAAIRQVIRQFPLAVNVTIGPIAISRVHIPATDRVCWSVGPGYGFTLDPRVAFSVSFGPVLFGDLNPWHVESTLSGWGATASVQPGIPLGGELVRGGSNGKDLFGPTIGTPGASVSLQYGWCK